MLWFICKILFYPVSVILKGIKYVLWVVFSSLFNNIWRFLRYFWDKFVVLFWKYIFHLYRVTLKKLFSRIKWASFLGRFWRVQLLKSSNEWLLIDGNKKKISERESFENLVLIARVWAWKSSAYVIPNILSLATAWRWSIVVTDPAGEIFKATSWYLEQKWYDIKIINPSNINQTLWYNPILKLPNKNEPNYYTELEELSHTLIESTNPDHKGDPIWYEWPKSIISVFIHCLKETWNHKYANFYNVLYLLQNFSRARKSVESFVKRHSNNYIWNKYKWFLTWNQNMIDSFISIAITSLQKLWTPGIAKIMTDDDVDFIQLRQKKTIIYLIVPSEKIEFYNFFTNMFYTQFFNIAMRNIPNEKDRPIYILYDEFWHSSIPWFQSKITTLRKFKVSCSLIIQSYSQLKERYGDNGAKTIVEWWVASKLFFAWADMETAKMVEELLWKVKHKDMVDIYNIQTREENLMNADRIRTLEEWKSVYVYGNKEPIILDMKKYFKTNPYKQYAKIKPYEFRGNKGYLNLEYLRWIEDDEVGDKDDDAGKGHWFSI